MPQGTAVTRQVNRKDEYLTLMSELENTPKQPEYAEKHAEERLKSEHRCRVFIVPLIKELVQVVVFSLVVVQI